MSIPSDPSRNDPTRRERLGNTRLEFRNQQEFPGHSRHLPTPPVSNEPLQAPQPRPPGDHGRRDALTPNTVLRDYTIEGVLGSGGFGIVYRARHNELGHIVAIKEYLPAELAVREGTTVYPRSSERSGEYEDCLERFREEAKALVNFQSHPSVVSCREFFRCNGTAYLVMDYEDGLSLSEVLRAREAEGRPFEEADLLAVMEPLLEGLKWIHDAGVLHRDIKPANILLRRRDERPVLIDFGAAKQATAVHSKSSAPFTEGYAAIEQVAAEGSLGPWTDLYAVGAVMWRMVAGGSPPWSPPNPVKVESRAHAVVRGSRDPMPPARELGAGRFSERVLAAIDRCLKLHERERFLECGELLKQLKGGPVQTQGDAGRTYNGGQRKRYWVAAGVIACVTVLGFSVAGKRESERAPESQPVGEADVLGRWDDNGDGRITCAEARGHGIAPVRRDHPAYPFMRDGDGDGVVCE